MRKSELSTVCPISTWCQPHVQFSTESVCKAVQQQASVQCPFSLYLPPMCYHCWPDPHTCLCDNADWEAAAALAALAIPSQAGPCAFNLGPPYHCLGEHRQVPADAACASNV